ncbi:MAG: hypothetical protein N3D12_00500 [Candidatus Methanomethyliaceae archaeon]|nr:hypothetical protein [Candidatus Methanomethyliaceae archaeon]
MSYPKEALGKTLKVDIRTANMEDMPDADFWYSEIPYEKNALTTKS